MQTCALPILVRKNRIDSAHPPKAQREFIIAIAAAAANAEFDAWSAYLGKWADALAFSVLDKQDADHLLADMELLSIIEIGRASCRDSMCLYVQYTLVVGP